MQHIGSRMASGSTAAIPVILPRRYETDSAKTLRFVEKWRLAFSGRFDRIGDDAKPKGPFKSRTS